MVLWCDLFQSHTTRLTRFAISQNSVNIVTLLTFHTIRYLFSSKIRLSSAASDIELEKALSEHQYLRKGYPHHMIRSNIKEVEDKNFAPFDKRSKRDLSYLYREFIFTGI